VELWVLVLLAIPIVLIAVGRNETRRRQARSATTVLEIDSGGVRRVLADGREERLDWHELTIVEVVRARWGPHAGSGGVVVLAGTDTAGALIPIDQLGEQDLVLHLSALPGFDMRRFTEAIEAPAPARLRIWTRDDPQGRSDEASR
jgi:hypothetical protein